MRIRKFRQKLQEEEKSPVTIRNYLSTIREYKEFIRKPLNSTTFEDFENYIWRLKNNGLSDRSINLKISRIRKFYSYLRVVENLSKQVDDILDYGYLEVENEDRNIFNERLIQKMLDSSLDLRVKVIIVLVFSGALNIRELEILRRENFIEKENYTKVKVYNPTRDKRRIIFVEEKYYKYVREYLNSHNDEYLFPSNYSEHLSNETINKLVQNSGYEVIGTSISINDLKIACYNYLFKKGFSVFTIAEMMNIKDINRLIKHIQTTKYKLSRELEEIFNSS